MQLIKNQEDFDKICEKLETEQTLFIDTEFQRKKTYYAKLSLVQIASKHHKVVIDVLLIDDLTGLKNLLANEEILKVFHAPDQDLDIFLHIFKQLPKNIFDTQIAAWVVGLDECMGYSRLCKALLNLELDKSLQNSNWLKRPLTDDLLEYAIKDVEYLIPLHRELSATLTKRKLWDTYNDKSAKWLKEGTYKINPDKVIKRMKLLDYSDRYKHKIKSLILLREECAQTLDLPRFFCAADKDLTRLCRELPTTEAELVKMNFLKKPIARRQFKKKLLELCAGLREFKL
ncbi:MAG: hypothetical protein COA94_07120 [Rickettsiales bacterium]|nr:MAG: hypothetical protein COA94_07120 [Rickettsiales bacterium]